MSKNHYSVLLKVASPVNTNNCGKLFSRNQFYSGTKVCVYQLLERSASVLIETIPSQDSVDCSTKLSNSLEALRMLVRDLL